MEMDYTEETPLTKKQIIRGFIVSLITVLIPFLISRLVDVRDTTPLNLFLRTTILCFFISAPFITYFGFKKYAEIDLNPWWYKKGAFKKSLFYGVGGILLSFILAFVIITPLELISPGLVYEETSTTSATIQESHALPDADGAETVAPSSNQPKNDSTFFTIFDALVQTTGIFVIFLFGVFMVETAFRGFLQSFLTKHLGSGLGIIFQALLFSLFMSALFFSETGISLEKFLMYLCLGLSLGIVKKQAKTLLAPAITYVSILLSFFAFIGLFYLLKDIFGPLASS